MSFKTPYGIRTEAEMYRMSVEQTDRDWEPNPVAERNFDNT